MFRHNEYISKEDYPFNAGYVIYANYFFPSTATGEDSDVPLKEFPKAFKQNFEYYVDNELEEDERLVIYKTFKDKKNFNDVANELNMSVKDLTVLRTKAFSKLRSVSRTKNVLSDTPYVPKKENRNIVTLGDVVVEAQLKVPDLSTGGGEYRIITVKKNKASLFSIRMSTKTNSMSDDEVHDFLVGVAELSSKIKLVI